MEHEKHGEPTEALQQEDASTSLATRKAGDESAMTVDANGFVRATNHREVWKTCQLWAMSSMVPRSFQQERFQNLPIHEVVSRVYFAHQSLCSVGMNPLTNLRFVAWIEGSPMFWGDLPLSIVLAKDMLAEDPDEYWLDKEYNVICEENKNLDALAFAAVCRMRSKGSKRWHKYVFTVKDAIAMGKLPVNYEGWATQGEAPQGFSAERDSRGRSEQDKWKASVWAKHTKRMLQMRARSWLIKDKYPHSTKGNQIVEFDAKGDVDASLLGAASSPKEAGVQTLPVASNRIDLNDIYDHDEVTT